jgi:hypothetical protein
LSPSNNQNNQKGKKKKETHNDANDEPTTSFSFVSLPSSIYGTGFVESNKLVVCLTRTSSCGRLRIKETTSRLVRREA